MPSFTNKKILNSKEQILGQMISGLNSIHRSLKTNYQLLKIYYLAAEYRSDLIYQSLIRRLIKDYHNGNEFK